MRGSAQTGSAKRQTAVTDLQHVDDVVGDVDREFTVAWQEQNLTPAGPADWRVVCRRVALALVGTGLSVEEIRDLEKLPEEERVDACIERLLSDERFAAYWAERWARTYVGHEEGPFLAYRRRKFVSWLTDQVQANRAYNQMVHDLIAAKGFMTDRPEVNFLTLTLQGGQEDGQPDPIKLAARTSRAVLGTRIDCLQCHDDFLENVWLGDPSQPRNGTQADFHGLAAFYATARFNPLQGIRDEKDRKYEFKFLHSDEPVVVEPNVPFHPELLPAAGSPRQRLAAWATHPDNRPAARAAVGRIWAFVFGKPLTKSVDDIPLVGTLPPGLDRLADDFAKHNFDTHRLIRTLMRLQVFRMDSRIPGGVTEAHEEAWAAFPLVPLRPEQVAGSIIQACRLSTLDRSTSALLQLQAFGEQNDFITRYGDTGEDEFKQEPVTITQRLLVMNGNLITERTKDNPVLNASTQIAMFAPETKDAVNATFLAVLNRLPNDIESSRFVQRIEETKDRSQALEDLYWALLNSTEFAWNH